jgi:NDP-sugar pyrophosphorylase family protein
MHRERRAKATIVLTPVENPSAYGLVETEPDGAVRQFVEKPDPKDITCDTINAGIYVLEPDTFDRIPREGAYSIERGYFPSLVTRKEPFFAYVDRGYWVDIGTPEKYVQVHRDMFDGKFVSGTVGAADRSRPIIAPDARVEEGARLDPACFIDSGAHVKAGAVIGRYTVIGRHAVVEEEAEVRGSIIWPNTRIGQHAVVENAILARNCHIGRNCSVRRDAVLGDKTVLTDYTRV